jgi:LPXTG-motif cell wall-anchored protein
VITITDEVARTKVGSQIGGKISLLVLRPDTKPAVDATPVVDATPAVGPAQVVNPAQVVPESAEAPSVVTPVAADDANHQAVSKAPTNTLASTGAELAGFIVAGALVVGLGFVLVVAARRRRRA